MIEAIAEKLNFSYTIRERTDGAYGAYENGSWNGMIGDLVDEVSLGLIWVTELCNWLYLIFHFTDVTFFSKVI